MKKIVFLLVFVLFAHILTAQETDETYTSTSDLLLQISSLPEMKLSFTQSFIFPFLQGDNPLTSGNNIRLALTGEISPISLNALFETVWTPVAFFEFSAGGRIGTGWNIELFGSEVYGIGINQPASGGWENNGSAFDGILWKAQVGGTIQFDLAAIYPGDWNHIVARSYHEINYKGYSRAKEHEAWYYENDSGENCNGFNYYGNFLIGYQMPIFLSLVGLLAEMELRLYDTPNRELWGDDLIRWCFSAILSFTITEQFGITLITQFITCRNFEQSNWKDLYYRDRTVDTSNPVHLEFYRVAAALTYRF
ncbi:MAG: hypothetical protein LBI28_08105 [Treponema sp.]|jgi:hypothetical protein|nr:hypothetical protein [Treponema sp.]